MAPSGITSAQQWKKVSQGEEVELPSGNVALIKRPGMEELFAAGVLPDELTKIALDKVGEAQGRPQDFKKKKAAQNLDTEMLQKFMQGENAVADIFQSFDRITEMCVVQPEVRWHMRRIVDEDGHPVMDKNEKFTYEKIPYAERADDVLYTDDVDMEDKTFIFNFVVGGTRDIATFRQEYGDALADVQSGEDVELPSE